MNPPVDCSTVDAVGRLASRHRKTMALNVLRDPAPVCVNVILARKCLGLIKIPVHSLMEASPLTRFRVETKTVPLDVTVTEPEVLHTLVSKFASIAALTAFDTSDCNLFLAGSCCLTVPFSFGLLLIGVWISSLGNQPREALSCAFSTT